MLIPLLLILPVGLSQPQAKLQRVELVARGTIAADATDTSGLTESITPSVANNVLASLGSGVTSTPQAGRYLFVADRGPLDGAAPYRCRMFTMDLAVDLAAGTITPKLVQTTLLSTADGRPFVGSASLRQDDDADAPGVEAFRLDPEAVRIGPDGSVYIAEEYRTGIGRFGADGRLQLWLAIPAAFACSHPSANPRDELPPTNTVGRQPNRGFEGLTITPDGGRLYAALQSPLIQDGALSSDGRRIGVNVRLLEVDLRSNATREFVYVLSNASLGLNELLCLPNGDLLAIERDGRSAAESRVKSITRFSIGDATDVSAISALPSIGLPEGVTPVMKSVVIDLLSPEFRLAGEAFPEKIEGLAIGPPMPDGRQTLLVTSDNDFKADSPTCLWLFALPDSVVAGTSQATAPPAQQRP